MDTPLVIIGYCILFCASATLYKALDQIMEKGAVPSSRSLALLLLCISYLQGALGLFLTGATALLPLPLFAAGFALFIAASYAAGPLAYRYYNSLINPATGMMASHFFPALAASAAALWRLAVIPQPRLSSMRDNFFSAGRDIIILPLIAGAVLCIVIYTARILDIEMSVRKSRSIRLAVRSLIVVTAGLLVSPVLLLAGYLASRIELFILGALFLIVNNLFFMMAQTRYRDFFRSLGKEVRLARYRKSILRGLDIDILHERLNDLMKEEKYYRNFDISMKSTADELSITPHQLSFYLNKKLRIDFRKFINTFRVEEAKQLLSEKFDLNVLTIGFHVGFGSKTSFNVTFKEFTGKTPTEYREAFLTWRR